MKLRNLKNLPVFYENAAEIIGRVEKGVIDDNFKLAYIVIDMPGEEPRMIMGKDFLLRNEAVIIRDLESIKSYKHGEELSINKTKIGDVIFNSEGKELGVISDFVISLDNKQVYGVEVSAGGIKDLLEGRIEIPLYEVCWKSNLSAVITEERGDLR